MAETPHRPNAPVDRSDHRGPQVRRELAQAAAAIEIADIDVSEALAAEQFELLAARGEDRGRPFSLVELVRLEESGEDFPSPGAATLVALKRVSERCRIRRELDLPRETCASPEGTACTCQQAAIDVLLADAVRPTRRRVAQLARKHHRSAGKPYVPPPKPDPEPREVLAEPQETNGHVEDPFPGPPAEPKPRPSRVIRRPPKWPRFGDMQF